MENIDTSKLPKNIEAEQALIGAILANNKAFEKVSEFLKPTHFADSIHSKIFEVISNLILRGHTEDVITLKNYFEQNGLLADVGGANYLIKLADSASVMTNVEYYAQFIYDKYLRRELIATGFDIVNNATKEDLDSIIELTATKIIDDLEAQSITLYLIENEQIAFKYVYYSPSLWAENPGLEARFNEKREQLLQLRIPLGTGLVGKVIQTGESNIFNKERNKLVVHIE